MPACIDQKVLLTYTTFITEIKMSMLILKQVRNYVTKGAQCSTIEYLDNFKKNRISGDVPLVSLNVFLFFFFSPLDTVFSTNTL